MKLSISWIKEYVELSKNINDQQIINKLVELGFEIEGEEIFGPVKGDLKVGKVKEIQELNEFKKPIRYCKVDIGNKILEIICGARNFKVDDLVIVAPPGTILPGDFKIGVRETYGKKSEGMICSAKELGMGDDHEGILVLKDKIKEGSDAKKILFLGEKVIDISVLPDRGYAMSVRGIARELATGFKAKFNDPVDEKLPRVPKSKKLKTKINTKKASKIALVRVENYDPKSNTPQFIKNRLIQSGYRAISLPVDLTNYFMIQMGQPLHAFDADKIQGLVSIRQAKVNEKIETLDHTKRILDSNDLVIADSKKSLSVAGIMGGFESEISESAKNLVIESAIFDRESISRTARKLKLQSEASKRFERGTDYEINEIAAIKTAAYLAKYGNGNIEGCAVVKKNIGKKRIKFDSSEIKRLIGLEIDKGTVKLILNNLGIKTRVSGKLIDCLIPSWRHDLTNSADLVEEIIRIYGYDKIKSALPNPILSATDEKVLFSQKRVGIKLAALNMHEVLNYPFVSENDFVNQKDFDQAIQIANPLSEEESFLRTSLLPGLLKASKRNLSRGQENIAIFELGSIFLKPKNLRHKILKIGVNKRPSIKDLSLLDALLPNQPKYVSGIFCGKTSNNLKEIDSYTWRDSIWVVMEVLIEFGITYDVNNAVDGNFHPGRCAIFKNKETIFGYAGEIHPKIVDKYGIDDKVFGFELNLDFLGSHQAIKLAPKFSNMPVVKEDFAFVVDKKIKAVDIRNTIKSVKPEIIETVKLFDVYEGKNLGEGKKSLAFNIRYRDENKTLSTDEISQLRAKIIEQVERKHRANLRS